MTEQFGSSANSGPENSQTWVFMDAWFRLRNLVDGQLRNIELEVEALGLPDLTAAVATIRTDLGKTYPYTENGEGFIGRGD